ncbi:MAG: glycosyltransferase family 2 protein [Microthrixaceae bacterium]
MDVDTFRGAFVVVRGQTVADVGLMDEVSLVGGEETEWHQRMAHSGWRVVFWPGASVLHKGSATVGGRGDLEVEYLKGALNYFDKHRSVAVAWLARFGSAGVLAGRWLGAALRGDRTRRGELARSIRVAIGARRSQS